MKAAVNSYKPVGRKDKQAELSPKLQEEVAKKRLELYGGTRFSGRGSRRTPEFREALAKECKDRIGGIATEQAEFFEKIILKYVDCFWIEGCDAPRVKNHKIHYRLKPGAKPVARQPIPVSPYDELRVEALVKDVMTIPDLGKFFPE